jgi:hypothetical protein
MHKVPRFFFKSIRQFLNVTIGFVKLLTTFCENYFLILKINKKKKCNLLETSFVWKTINYINTHAHTHMNKFSPLPVLQSLP